LIELTEWDWWSPSDAFLDHSAEHGQVGRIGHGGYSVTKNLVDFLAGLLLPFWVENHGQDEAVERATDGEDCHRAQHAHGICGFGIIKAKCTRTRFCLLALKVSSGVAGVGGTCIHFLADLFQQTLPKLLFLLPSETDLLDGGVEPFGEASEEGHQVGDGARWGDLRDEFAGVLAMGCCRVRFAIVETSTNAAAESIGQSKVVEWITDELVNISSGFMGDVAVVFLVEGLVENGVGEFALLSPMVWHRQ